MIDPEIVHNVIIINNTNLSYDEIINQYELTTDYRSKFSPRVQKPPQVFNMVAKYGSEPENAWRNFLYVCGQQPWTSIVYKDDLNNKPHFLQKLLSLGSNYIYMKLILITKEDPCKVVFDKNPANKEETITFLKEEIAFREQCSKYVFDTIEYYPDMDHYDQDRYQDIVNTYNEIK